MRKVGPLCRGNIERGIGRHAVPWRVVPRLAVHGLPRHDPAAQPRGQPRKVVGKRALHAEKERLVRAVEVVGKDGRRVVLVPRIGRDVHERHRCCGRRARVYPCRRIGPRLQCCLHVKLGAVRLCKLRRDRGPVENAVGGLDSGPLDDEVGADEEAPGGERAQVAVLHPHA